MDKELYVIVGKVIRKAFGRVVRGRAVISTEYGPVEMTSRQFAETLRGAQIKLAKRRKARDAKKRTTETA